MELDWLKKNPGLAGKGPQALGRPARSLGAHPAIWTGTRQ